jgi:hypothetical protein
VFAADQSRLENAPSLREAIRLSYALVDLWMDSYERAPSMVTLDIDDTVDVVHGRQQLSLFNAHYDEHCFLPIHVYDTERSVPVAVVLRPGKTPSGVEVRGHLRRLVRHIRRRWPNTRITFRGDGHYACPEAMTWCEKNGVDYVFGLAGTKPLARKVDEVSDYCAYEKLTARGFMIVEMASATALCNRSAEPLNTDHIEISKPGNIDASSYIAFKAAYAETVIGELKQQFLNRESIRLRNLRQFICDSFGVVPCNREVETITTGNDHLFRHPKGPHDCISHIVFPARSSSGTKRFCIHSP